MKQTINLRFPILVKQGVRYKSTSYYEVRPLFVPIVWETASLYSKAKQKLLEDIQKKFKRKPFCQTYLSDYFRFMFNPEREVRKLPVPPLFRRPGLEDKCFIAVAFVGAGKFFGYFPTLDQYYLHRPAR